MSRNLRGFIPGRGSNNGEQIRPHLRIVLVMNVSVCQSCRRFGGKMPDSDTAWLCAEIVYMTPSDVIPGHRFLRKDNYHPICADMELPPTWCERPLEQTICDPNEKVNIESHDQRLVYDGNQSCEFRVLNKHRRENW